MKKQHKKKLYIYIGIKISNGLHPIAHWSDISRIVVQYRKSLMKQKILLFNWIK